MKHELSFQIVVNAISSEARLLPKRGIYDPAFQQLATLRTQLDAAMKSAVPTSFEAPDSSGGGNAFKLAVEQLAAEIDDKALQALTSVLGPPPCQNGKYMMMDEEGPICKDCDPPKANCHIVDGKMGTSCPKSLRMRTFLWSPKADPNATFSVQIKYQYGISHV